MARRTKERAGEVRRYTFKLYPTTAQAEVLQSHAHMCGDLWNALLQRNEDTYRIWCGEPHRRADDSEWDEKGADRIVRKIRSGVVTRPRLSLQDMTNEITLLRHECPEWAEVSVWMAHRVAESLDQAFKAFFARAKAGAGKASGYPRFKPRRFQTSIPHRGNSGFDIRPKRRDGLRRQLHWLVTIKGIPGSIRAMGRLPDKPVIDRCLYADVQLREGVWWCSIATEMPKADRLRVRDHGAASRLPRDEVGAAAAAKKVESRKAELAHIKPRPTVVKLNLIDCIAEVNGRKVYADDIGLDLDGPAGKIEAVQARMSQFPRFGEEWQDCRRQLARISAKTARRRREALHVWTTDIIRSASQLVVIKPASVKDDTASARGTEKDHGAAIKTKAEINRAVLSQAPALVVTMLQYKAAEAGIPYEERDDPDTLSAGAAVVANAKAVRKARRAIRREANA